MPYAVAGAALRVAACVDVGPYQLRDVVVYTCTLHPAVRALHMHARLSVSFPYTSRCEREGEKCVSIRDRVAVSSFFFFPCVSFRSCLFGSRRGRRANPTVMMSADVAPRSGPAQHQTKAGAAASRGRPTWQEDVGAHRRRAVRIQRFFF